MTCFAVFVCLVFCLLISKLLSVELSDCFFFSIVLFAFWIKEKKNMHVLHLGPPTLLSELVTEPGIQWPGFVPRLRPLTWCARLRWIQYGFSQFYILSSVCNSLMKAYLLPLPSVLCLRIRLSAFPSFCISPLNCCMCFNKQ